MLDDVTGKAAGTLTGQAVVAGKRAFWRSKALDLYLQNLDGGVVAYAVDGVAQAVQLILVVAEGGLHVSTVHWERDVGTALQLLNLLLLGVGSLKRLPPTAVSGLHPTRRRSIKEGPHHLILKVHRNSGYLSHSVPLT